mmetsp:Transcript_22822/g.17270  ORF Transcript_22822/g.17270 Transcript_22822/m.17270 type:complete len:83 (+) Transcript_22822:1010-1258(+)
MRSELMEESFSYTVDYNEEYYMDVSVVLRPHLMDVLEYLSNSYELVIFTASEQKYAEPILNHLDPTGELFSAKLYRDSCLHL